MSLSARSFILAQLMVDRIMWVFLHTLGENAAVVRHGFFSSMRPGQGALYFNVNTAATTFHISQTLYAYLEDMGLNRHPISDTTKQGLTGFKVRFLGDPLNKRRGSVTYPTSGQIIWNLTSRDINAQCSNTWYRVSSVYHRGDGAPVTDLLIEYRIPHTNLKTAAHSVSVGKLTVGAHKVDTWYPSDQLMILDWQPYKRKLTTDITSQMLKMAAKPPDRNQALILQDARGPLGITD